LVQSKFSWQEGYGAFSYSKVEVPAIIQYIINQTNHHKRKTFSEEYYEIAMIGINHQPKMIL
jgi:hypothetical protein